MTKQLLIYEQVVPISKERHKDWSLKQGSDYGFARQINSVPLMAVEFANAVNDYAIVFVESEAEIMPIAILGVKQEENQFVSETGSWNAKYIPAFIRRYPFIFSSSDDGQTFTLCIDETFEGLNQEGKGERFFDVEGEQTQYLNNVLEFLKEYQKQFQITQFLGKKLKELDLLEPMKATFQLKTGEESSLTGFSAVSTERLRKLSGEQLVDLMQTGQLDLLYLHLHSMRNFSLIIENT